MRVLGLDPGATTGWCLYDDEQRRVLDCGTVPGDSFLDIPRSVWGRVDVAIIERPVAHGPTRPEVVECAWVAGCLWRDMLHLLGRSKARQMRRLEVRQVLTAATHGVVRCTNDATVWAALVLLHGEGSDRKPKTRKGEVIDDGGPLGRVTSHARAALAVAVAWTLRAQEVPA